MINKHGLNINGLRKASSATVSNNPLHCIVYYDATTGSVWTREYADRNSWTQYDGEVLQVARTQDHLTMQQIADAIARRMEEITVLRHSAKKEDDNGSQDA